LILKTNQPMDSESWPGMDEANEFKPGKATAANPITTNPRQVHDPY